MKIAVIGGGASGMMAAAHLNEISPDLEVVLVERNSDLGQKVLISGGGRCNVTTALEDLNELTSAYPRGAKFLRSIFHRVPPSVVMAWFESHGVPLKVEAHHRVFPRSNSGQDILNAFKEVFHKSKTKILFKSRVTEIHREGEQFRICIQDGADLLVERLILSCGGQAYRQTGSTGDAYSFASSLGHQITPLAASLNSFILSESWPASLAGVSIPRVLISSKLPEYHEALGPILFTHRGITGPAVFVISSWGAFVNYAKASPLPLQIDFLPDQSFDSLEEFFDLKRKNTPKEILWKIETFKLPRSLLKVLSGLSGIPEGIRYSELNKKSVHLLIQSLKKCPLNAVARASGEEFVTAGGVDIDEVNPKTMESKICTGLYFAGEILNIDGFTGGFNLQSAWATGMIAAQSVAQSVQNPL